MTAGMVVLLLVFLSAVVLHSVAAGGVYCAKTARARAAAMGLDYPGVHGAPDLLGQAHVGMQPRTMPFRPHPYDSNPPNMARYRPNQAAADNGSDRHEGGRRAHFDAASVMQQICYFKGVGLNQTYCSRQQVTL
ncbi:hypothetical protein PAMA_015421 [Pampus argenteus]